MRDDSMIPAELKPEILIHLKKEFPREGCGLIVNLVGEAKYFPCRNISRRDDMFILSPEDYAIAEEQGEVLRVVHSHCYTNAMPSQADLASCEATQLPWSILSLPNETWHHFEPSGYRAPLVGREFVHGVQDCYTLVRDWYRAELGIEIMDFDRSERWWETGGDLYMQNFEKAGFRKITDGTLKRGDGILMKIRSNVANHAAIYLGDGTILHHLYNRLSGHAVYGGYWLKNTAAVVRYLP